MRGAPARAVAPVLAALALAACSDDVGMPLPDASPDGGAMDSAFVMGPVTSTYEGELPPRNGYCNGAGEVQTLEAVPATELLDTRSTLVDHARPSTACAVSSASVTPDFVFTYTPPGPGVFTVRTDLPGTNPFMDTIVYVRSGCAGDGEELACNDDAGGSSGPSRLTLELEEAVPLFIVVDGFSDVDVGAVEVGFDFVPVPTPSGPGADLCADATDLVFSGEGDTLIATAMGDTEGSGNDDGCAGVPSTYDLPDRFYAFTIEDTRDVTVTVAPDMDYDPAFYILPDCGAPDALLCYDNGPPGYTESSTAAALPAGRYVIGVDAFVHASATNYESGTYTLEVVATTP